MTRAKWENANLQPEPGFSMLPSLYEARRYRGLVLYEGYDLDGGGFWGDQWDVTSEKTGDVILVIRADEDRAFQVATKLAEMLDWTSISDGKWRGLSLDPAFLAFMAEHYREVMLPIVEDDLEAIVPFGVKQDASEPNSRTAVHGASDQ